MKKKKRENAIRNTKRTDRLTTEAFERIIQAQGNKCLKCGKEFTEEERPTRDHVIPLSRGGKDTTDNVCALCHRCNAQKADDLDYDLIVSRKQLEVNYDG